jgi:hypothetical protein
MTTSRSTQRNIVSSARSSARSTARNSARTTNRTARETARIKDVKALENEKTKLEEELQQVATICDHTCDHTKANFQSIH